MRWLVVLSVLLFASPLLADNGVPLPHGYRDRPYKAPTPDSVPGGITLDFSDEVAALVKSENMVLINVSPITLSPPAQDGRRIWIPKRGYKYLEIPGSYWLPNVGEHDLDESMAAYFRTNLSRLTQGQRDRAVMFYCTADCWMSWNAAKRAAQEYGYTNVYWFPIGIDGWKGDGRPAAEATPEPFSPLPSAK